MLLICCLLAWSRRGNAQDQNRPFIKISHIGVERRPLLGAFISTRQSALDEKLELVPGYRSEPVFVVSKAEFNILFRFASRYAAAAREVPSATDFGTFQLTFSDGKGTEISVVTGKDDSLDFITELSAVVDGFDSANRKAPELWEALKGLASRLAY